MQEVQEQLQLLNWTFSKRSSIYALEKEGHIKFECKSQHCMRYSKPTRLLCRRLQQGLLSAVYAMHFMPLWPSACIMNDVHLVTHSRSSFTTTTPQSRSHNADRKTGLKWWLPGRYLQRVIVLHFCICARACAAAAASSAESPSSPCA